MENLHYKTEQTTLTKIPIIKGPYKLVIVMIAMPHRSLSHRLIIPKTKAPLPMSIPMKTLVWDMAVTSSIEEAAPSTTDNMPTQQHTTTDNMLSVLLQTIYF